MSTPRYSYSAINALASGDTGHFVFLDAWSVSLLGSMLSQERSIWLWANDQNPLTESELNDLDNKLSTAQDQLMQSLIGLIMPVATGATPQGCLLCDGSTHSRTDYPNLYAALDSAFIIDADSFFVPDLQDLFVRGASDLNPPGTTGGETETTLTVDQLPSHTHTTQPHAHSEVAAAPTIINGGLEAPASAATPVGATTGFTTVSVDYTGGGEPVRIIPPFFSLQYVIVAL